jgi:hypothetical protein
MNPVPATAVGIVAIVDDDNVRRVVQVRALVAGTGGGLGTNKLEVNVDAEGQVDLETGKDVEGLGGGSHEGGLSDDGGLHFGGVWFALLVSELNVFFKAND